MATEYEANLQRIETAKEDLKQAISGKGVSVPSTAKIEDLAPLVTSIPQFDTSDANAVAGDILLNKTAYANGKKVTGTMPNNGKVTNYLGMNAVGFFRNIFYIPEGYHDGTGTVLINGETTTVTPNESIQEIVPKTNGALQKVTVNAIPDSYIIPSGTKTITSAGTHDVKAYASATVGSGSAKVTDQSITATNTITIDDNGLITATASGSKSISPTVSAGYVSSGTAGTVSVTGTKTMQLPTFDVKNPTVRVSADDEEGEIYVSASTELPKGYTNGGSSGVVGKYIKLKIEGDTAVMYNLDDQSQEVRRKVGASIATCNVTINIVDNVGNLGVTATQFVNGAVTTFRENKSSGTFTIPNVVCGSIITIVCNGWFSIDGWSSPSAVGSTSLALIAPTTTGNYSANIIAYDD